MSEPKYLYRYRPFNDFSKDILINNRLWFSSPNSFNDPFDCKIAFSFTSQKEELKLLLSLPFSDGEYYRKRLEYDIQLGFHKTKEWQAAVVKAFEDMSISSNFKTGMLCLSEHNNDILMWSHYSDSHKGICFQFDTKLLSQEADYLQPMKYQDAFPKFVEVFGDPMKGPSKMLLYKAKHWKYEKEWRWIKFPMIEKDFEKDLGNQNYDFPPEMLTGVIFGCEMKKEDREVIKHLVQSNPKLGHVKFHEAKKKPNEFGLNIVPPIE